MCESKEFFEARPVGRMNLWYVQVMWGKEKSFVNYIRAVDSRRNSII